MNVASRVEALNKELGSQMLVTEEVWNAAGNVRGAADPARAAPRPRSRDPRPHLPAGMTADVLRDDALARRDRREGGSWTPLQRIKNDALWAGGSAVLALVRRLPLPILRALGRAVGELAHAIDRSGRRRALANVALALPELDGGARRILVRRTYATLGEYLGEGVAFLRDADRPLPLELTSEACSTLERAMREGRGVVFASAHLGPWERVRRLPRGRGHSTRDARP